MMHKQLMLIKIVKYSREHNLRWSIIIYGL